MKLLYLIAATSVALTACSTKEILSEETRNDTTVACPPVICTEEFRSVIITYKDKDGLVGVSDYSAVIKRTGKPTHYGPVQNVNATGTFFVATDADTKSLLTSGDTIIVKATNPKTNLQKTTEFVIVGGPCACHIEKKLGPDQIEFD